MSTPQQNAVTRQGGGTVNHWVDALNERVKGEKGVTLIELLAVIVIIAIIAAIAVPVILGAIKNSKINSTKQDMTVIAEALNRYAADHDGQFPASLSTLTQTDSSSGNSPYLQALPKDPWGNEITYQSNGTGYDLTDSTADLELTNLMTAPTSPIGAQNPGHIANSP